MWTSKKKWSIQKSFMCGLLMCEQNSIPAVKSFVIRNEVVLLLRSGNAQTLCVGVKQKLSLWNAKLTPQSWFPSTGLQRVFFYLQASQLDNGILHCSPLISQYLFTYCNQSRGRRNCFQHCFEILFWDCCCLCGFKSSFFWLLLRSGLPVSTHHILF